MTYGIAWTLNACYGILCFNRWKLEHSIALIIGRTDGQRCVKFMCRLTEEVVDLQIWLHESSACSTSSTRLEYAESFACVVFYYIRTPFSWVPVKYAKLLCESFTELFTSDIVVKDLRLTELAILLSIGKKLFLK